MAELIRRAVDVFLAWDDPAYLPTQSPNKERPFLPALKDAELSGRLSVTHISFSHPACYNANK